MFSNDFSAQELESDTVFLNKAKALYRYNPRDIQTITDDFRNKSSIQFFIGKNKNEIYDSYLKEASKENLVSAVKILERICLDEIVDIAYKKHIAQALARMMHSGIKNIDDNTINSSYLYIIKYWSETDQIDIFNQMFEIHNNMLFMIQKTSWGHNVFYWAYKRISHLFLDMPSNKLAAGSSVKYGNIINKLSKFIISKYNSTGVLPEIDSELVKKVLFHINDIRNEAAETKGRTFFNSTSSPVFTNSIEFAASAELYEILEGVKGTESLFNFTNESIIEILTEESGSGGLAFKKELKNHIVGKMFKAHSEKMKEAIAAPMMKFKTFLIDVLKTSAELTAEKDPVKGDIFFTEKLSVYLNRDSYASSSKLYRKMEYIFNEYATIDDIADIFVGLDSIDPELYAVPYYWSPDKVMYTSVLKPKNFLAAKVLDNKTEELIDKILEKDGSKKLCGDILSRTIRRLLNDKKRPSEEGYEESDNNIEKTDMLFGKYGHMFKEFEFVKLNMETDIIRISEYPIFISNNCLNVIDFMKKNPVEEKYYGALINSIFAKTGMRGDIAIDEEDTYDPVKIIEKLVEFEIIDKKMLFKKINIKDGIEYSLFDKEEVMNHILEMSRLEGLADILEYFVKQMNDYGFVFAKEIVAFMVGAEFSKHIDEKFSMAEKREVKKWADTVENTMLSSGKLIPMGINEEEKNEKVRLMFEKHFNI